MLFHTYPFLVFFVVVFAVYWSLRHHRARMVWLLLASAYFYARWNPWLIGLIVFSATVDYAAALALERLTTPWKRRLLLLSSISTNLGLLAFFKYVNFFLDTAHTAASIAGLPSSRVLYDVVLPLGISFYTFETISYIVDVYRGRVPAVRNPLDYALYIMFFPHLIAGPIVRPRDFLPQLRRPKRWSWGRLQFGIQLFLLGLCKKLVLADNLAQFVDPVFAEPAAYGSTATWLAVLAYAGQIYGDFSGYSDMAVGLAQLLGFRLPANFNMPYFAANLVEFWRRWHISLSSWLRDYLYIPLGGGRGKLLMTCRNLLITMLLGGLWHGANWTFVVWGLYHGLLLVLHRLMPPMRWLNRPIFKPLCVGLTFLAVCLGWVFFRAPSFTDAGVVLERLAWPTAGLGLGVQGAAAVLGLLGLLMAGHLAGTFVNVRKWERRLPAPVLGTALAGVLLLILILVPEDGKAFIYFQF